MNSYKENIEQKNESIQIFTSLKKLGFPKWWIEDGSSFPFLGDSQTSVRLSGLGEHTHPFSSCSLNVISKTKNKDYQQELGAPNESATWHFKTWPKLPCPSSVRKHEGHRSFTTSLPPSSGKKIPTRKMDTFSDLPIPSCTGATRVDGEMLGLDIPEK